MIIVLPLSMIEASWGMLLFNKPSCKPSLVGIIKNSVLLIDFYQHNRKAGNAPLGAALESVRIRFRPAVMTAFEWAVGLAACRTIHEPVANPAVWPISKLFLGP
jgi:multidrug efflux pump subunit AcrB